MTRKTTTTADALEILHYLFYEGKRRILELRTQAGLNHAQLGKKIGTDAALISRLEEADYEGNSFVMLRKIAAALDQTVEIHIAPVRRSA